MPDAQENKATYRNYTVSYIKHTLTASKTFTPTEQQYTTASETARGAVQDCIEGILEKENIQDSALHQIPFEIRSFGQVVISNDQAAFSALKPNPQTQLSFSGDAAQFLDSTGFSVGVHRYTNFQVV